MEMISKKSIDAKVRASLPLNHKWHNNFHLEAPFGLINDPNGLAYLDGKYHVFYQWNPIGCEHKNKCWGHVTTEDFVNYSAHELSMWPSDEYDKNGCYSGSGFAENGKVRLLYTNNAKDSEGNRLATQRIATLLEDGSVSKDEIIVSQPAEGYTPHYRDPYYFKLDGSEYIVIGAQRKNETGAVVIYRRDQKGCFPLANEKWSFMGELKTDYTDFGYMWECPGILQLKDENDGKVKEVLMFCPQGLEAEEYQYQNKFQSGYVVGNIDLGKMHMNHGKFVELDKGFDFYAPQVLNRDGRYILFGWMGMPDNDFEYVSKDLPEKGWVFSLTMPRELTLKDDHVYSAPVKELEALRAGNEKHEAKDVNDVQWDLPKTAEVELDIELGDAGVVSFELAFGEEKLVFNYDRKLQVMMMDRNGMELGGKGIRTFKLPAQDKLNLHLFIDKGAVEAFFQDGYTVASTLIYKKEDVAASLKINADKSLVSALANVYGLGAYSYSEL